MARADDEEADLDRIVPLLERYPLNTTLGLGEPLTSDEISRKQPIFFTSRSRVWY